MKPLKHSAYLRLQALKERFWHVDDKLACLLTLSVSDVAKHIPDLFSEVLTCFRHLRVMIAVQKGFSMMRRKRFLSVGFLGKVSDVYGCGIRRRTSKHFVMGT